ncbi:MAG: hypothetical protein HY264_02080, partial [Chloroflexi bacterium]|nr:hypothetical protein [Chloroflexota bacterium]
ERRAIELADQVLEVAERTDQLNILADTLVTKGSAMVNVGRRREGGGVLDAGGKLAEANGFTSVVLRAINNGLSIKTENDPRAAFEMAQSGIALARRLGQSGWIHAFAGNLGFVALRTGEWDIGIAELEGALADTTDPLDRILLLNNLVNLRAVRGLPHDDMLDEMRATVAAHPITQNQVFITESLGWSELCAGQLAQARESWLEMARQDPVGGAAAYAWTARLAIWLGDRHGAEEDVPRYWEAVAHGGVVDAVHLGLRAGLAAMRGDRVAAGQTYRDALRQIREFRLPIDEAMLAIDMVHVLGPDDPGTSDVVATARPTLVALGATPLLALLDAAVADPGRGVGSGAAAGAAGVLGATGAAGAAGASGGVRPEGEVRAS